MNWKLLLRQLVGVVLCPIAIVLLTIQGLGEIAERLYDRILEAMNDALGKP